jgi:tRNA U34 5-methylaminomethyl-2-thiouridine-forming methyltransferase MnmC
LHPYDPKITTTSDGSHSLYVAGLDEHYHSHHGALQEAAHVFIGSGLDFYRSRNSAPCRIFEVGFGTGLNALLSAIYASVNAFRVSYTAIELYPIDEDLANSLNYAAQTGSAIAAEIFKSLHRAPWSERVEITPLFDLYKVQADMLTYGGLDSSYDLIFFDAFGYRAQSELWSDAVFERCFRMLRPGGYLTTYASKGVVRRSMQAAGFLVEKLPGPPGKREMVRAQKPI